MVRNMKLLKKCFGHRAVALAVGLNACVSLAPTVAAQQDPRQEPNERRQEQPAPPRPGRVPGQNVPGEPALPPQLPPEQSARARVQQMLRNVDPEMLKRLLGAEVTVEVVGGKVIIKGPEESVKALELLLRGLDLEVEVPEVRVVQVTERDAKEVARTVQEALRKAWDFPTQRPQQEVTLTAVTSNTIIVAAPPSKIDQVVEIIEKVDAVPDPLGKIELMTFDVKFRRASQVSVELEKTLVTLQKSQGITADKSKLQIIPNDANNTIAVTAREAERPKIQSIIDTIDVEPKKGWGETKLTVFPLLHSKAKDFAEVVKKLLTTAAQGQSAGGGTGGAASRASAATQELIYRLVISKALPTGERIDIAPIDLQKPLKIEADEGTNSLIVATVEENVGPIGELIRLLDGVPLGEDVDLRVFPLRFADVETVRDMLEKMFEKGKKLPEDPDGSAQNSVPSAPTGKALVYGVGLAADERTNTLLVSGRPEQIALVEKVVQELDRPISTLKFPLRLVPLKHADVSRLAEIVINLMEKRVEAAEKTGATKTALERERVFLTVDIRSNSLIVSASEENYAEILKITGQLDKAPVGSFDQLRLIPCTRLTAKDLKDKIDELWGRRNALRSAQELIEDKPVIAVDERANVLIVAASVEDFEEIARLVKVLESQPMPQDTSLFKLQYSDATVIAGMLDKLFEGLKSRSETFQPPTILPDLRANALVVAATPDAMDRVADLVKRLDVESGPKTAIFKVYPLQYASSLKLATRMQELFDQRNEEQDTPKTPIVILAEESSNSLISSASRDDHEVVGELLGLLDRPSSISRQFQIFPLKMAKAAKVAERLESLFKSQGADSAGRADSIATEADERTNSLIVWAAPSDMENIADVILRLDTSTPAVDMMIKVIQLRQALATDFAELLTKTLIGEDQGGDDQKAVIVSFSEKRRDGTSVVRKLLRQDIKVEPDPRTNSLMVMAPTDSMAMLEAMIQDFDRIRPVTSEIRLFPLTNSDAETLVEQLTELFTPDSSGTDGETKSQLVFGNLTEGLDLASVGQELRFTADPRTNTLIAAGAEVYLRMVEDLVRNLDSQEMEDRYNIVYPVKFGSATDIASAVTSFVEQEQSVLGESDDQSSMIRKQERQVSIEAVGDEEEGSSQLLVGTSLRAYQRTMDLIHGLDRPEPQVMISVLIAEVILDDDVELGVEIAGQELDFTRNAVLGPNGVLEGSDFDFVGGTDLGAAGLGLGGFNFTITGEDFSFLFHALQTDSRVEVLSRPILLVRNGQEGKITIADQVPYVESTQINDTGSTNSSVGREDVGIVLTATPQISPDGYVTIKLKQELSNIAGENIQLTEGVSSPIFQTREVDTNVTVRDGETVVIGGLISARESEAENKVPILGDIPLLGWLGRRTAVSKSRGELLIVLTVDILRTDEDRHQMSIAQRDLLSLPDSAKRSPLMGGLRITPEEKALGPVGRDLSGPGAAVPPAGRPSGNQQFGPKPKTYGPQLPPPSPGTSTTSAAIYGPKIAEKKTEESGRVDK